MKNLILLFLFLPPLVSRGQQNNIKFFVLEEILSGKYYNKSIEQVKMDQKEFGKWKKAFEKKGFRKKIRKVKSIKFTGTDFKKETCCNSLSSLLTDFDQGKNRITQVIFDGSENDSINLRESISILEKSLNQLKALKLRNFKYLNTANPKKNNLDISELRLNGINIESESFTNLDSFFPSIQHLALDTCNLTYIGKKNIGSFKALKTLSLRGNHIKKITWIPPQLVSINLSGNNLTEVPTIFQVDSLKKYKHLDFINIDCNFLSYQLLETIIKNFKQIYNSDRKKEKPEHFSFRCNNIDEKEISRLGEKIFNNNKKLFKYYSGEYTTENDFRPFQIDCSRCNQFKFNSFSAKTIWELQSQEPMINLPNKSILKIAIKEDSLEILTKEITNGQPIYNTKKYSYEIGKTSGYFNENKQNGHFVNMIAKSDNSDKLSIDLIFSNERDQITVSIINLNTVKYESNFKMTRME